MNKMVHALIAVGMFWNTAVAHADGVTMGDKEWRQLTDTSSSFSWNQVATVCDETTGVCTGSLGGVNFTGWIWATNTDVQELFDALIQPAFANFPTPETNYFSRDYGSANDPDIAAAFGDGKFDATFQSTTARTVWGWTRSSVQTNPTQAFAPFIVDVFNPVGSQTDSAALGARLPKDTTRGDVGVWLYRAATATVESLISDLLEAVSGLGPGSSLADKVATVEAYVEVGDTQSACEMLHAFTNQVNAQSGKQLAVEEAGQLLNDADGIRVLLKCP